MRFGRCAEEFVAVGTVRGREIARGIRRGASRVCETGARHQNRMSCDFCRVMLLEKGVAVFMIGYTSSYERARGIFEKVKFLRATKKCFP